MKRNSRYFLTNPSNNKPTLKQMKKLYFDRKTAHLINIGEIY